MDLLCQDIIKLLVEHHLSPKDSLALFCVSKKFSAYHQLYGKMLLDVRHGLNVCIYRGNLRAVKFFYSRCKFAIFDYHTWCLRISCESGSLEIVKWLIAIKIDCLISHQDLFQISYNHNHIAIACWLIDYGKSINVPIDIHVYRDHAFRSSCSCGYLDIAQWLITLSIETNSPIDIHACNEDAFQSSCLNGRLDIALWLIQLGIETNSPIDIHCDNNVIFRKSHLYGKLCIAKWLVQLDTEINSPIHASCSDY